MCHKFKVQCCTYIANNTAPDGSATKASHGLWTLPGEMHKHSGIRNSLCGPLTDWF